MKLLILAGLVAVACGATVNTECAWGESYWCSSIGRAKRCGAVQHCLDTVWSHQKVKEDDDVCQFCESIIKDVRAFVDDKDNQQKVKTFLDNACNIIPDEQLANLCKESVNNDFDELIQLIDSELDPAIVCSAMGLCPAFKDQVKHAPVKETPVKETPVKKEGDNVCEFCQNIIKDVRALIDDKDNQQKIKSLLDTICDVIPDGEISKVCRESINLNYDEFMKLIDSELDPAKVCSAMAVCSVSKDTPKITLIKKAKTNDAVCDDCKKLMTDLKAKLTSATTEKEVEQLIEQELCAELGPYEDMCKLAVESYLPQLMQMLSQDVDPAIICQALSFCTATAQSQLLLSRLRLQQSPLYKMAQKQPAGSEECMLCKLVLTELQSLDRDQTVQAEVETFIKTNLCAKMGSLKEACDSTVDSHGAELFELLANELDPEVRCQSLGFCAPAGMAPARLATPAKKPVKVSAAPSTECVLCEFVMKEVDQIIGENATQDEIISALESVCSVLPDTIKETCDDFVKQYGPLVISLLEQELDPQQVCTAIKLCSAVSGARRAGDVPAQCVLCEFVATQLDQMLKENATQADIKAALDKVCSFLPQSFSQECTALVNEYEPAIVALLEAELEADQLCKVLGLCPPSAAPAKKVAAAAQVKFGPQCTVCKLVMHELGSMLTDNNTEAEIESALEKVCSILPGSVRGECDDFVETYGRAVLQLLLREVTPQLVCAALGLCEPVKAPVKDDEMCGVCETVIQYVDSLLQENDTLAQIEKTLDKVCNFLPDNIRKQCQSMVDQYTPEIINLVTQLADPRQICTELGLCSPQRRPLVDLVPVKAHLLGTNKCTFGPSYWCSNMENAKRCNAVDHCNKHVWN